MPKASKYKGFTAYYVEIIPKKATRYDICFVPSDNKIGRKSEANECIRQIDGASFYELVTGEKDALASLFDALPSVIEKCMGTSRVLQSKQARKMFKLAYGIDV